ncbi:uncharacterized protein LOC112094003 [Morus notabilis]|uniref:uncharacterized protein LOC112094003 n=1 Tax=Morus notabilis TaxID=981085 RepID=UPI000CED0E5E|nr:uncharacterized protein LOC112094003 [Morus notabilis]
MVSELKRDDDVKLLLNLVRHSKEGLGYPLVVDFISSSVSAAGSTFSSCCFMSSRDKASSSNDDGFVCQFEDDIDVVMNNILIEDLDISKLPMSFDVNVGNQFMSKSVLKKLMHVIAIRRHFEFKSERSNNSFYVLVCKNKNCTWKMRVAKVSNGNVWAVKKYVKEHTCSLDVVSVEHRQANSRVVSEFLKGDFNIELADRLRPNDLRFIMHGKHGVEISYYKAQMACRYALASMRGSAVESYASIPFLCNVFKEKNPGSVISYELDNDGRFKYFFVCLGASINGWRHYKPVISVDGTFLKNEFSGTLLLYAVLDADNHIFPLGFAIVDSETDSSWEWFFERLKEAIGTREELVIVYDRKSSILKAVDKVFSDASHGFCMQHLLRNLNSNFKGVHVVAIFYRCAKANRKEDFGYFMRQLEAVRPAIRNYLLQVGVEKEYPIEALIEHFRSLLQRWFYERRNKVDQTFTYLTKHANKCLRDKEKIARCFYGSKEEVVLPLGFKRGAGRPRKQRILSSGEQEKRSVKCSRCKQVGHNRRTCSNPTSVDMN